MENDKAIYEVTVPQRREVINFEEYAMTSAGVLKQVQVIQEVMHGVMKIDEHYGIIPGTARACPDCKGTGKVKNELCANCNGSGKKGKPSLYKAGAEKLSLTFRLRPEYDIRRSELPGGHREYEVICTLYHIPTGQSVGQGVGSATTMEGKYRYRGGEKEGTGQPIPKDYWNLKKTDPGKAQTLIGGPGFSAGKIDGNWEICSIGEKQEHDNPADYYNTVLKMSKKRAHVDAILTATAASDIFTQDVEDMPEVIEGAKKEKKQTALPQEEKPKEDQVSLSPESLLLPHKEPQEHIMIEEPDIKPASDDQKAELMRLMKAKGFATIATRKPFYDFVMTKDAYSLAEKFINQFDEYYLAYSRKLDADAEGQRS